MKPKERNDFKEVSKTMLIPMWARAYEQTKPNPIIRDDEALETLQKLGYDLNLFNPKKTKGSQVGCCIRGVWMDKYVKHFISEHEDAVVVHIGCGLDNRYRRIGSPKNVQWYEMDLPEALELRKKVVEDDKEVSFIPESMFETNWMKELASLQQPTLLVIEGVIMYLQEADLRQFFKDLAKYFPQVWLLIDIVPVKAVNHAKYHDTLSEMKGKVEFTFTVKHPKDLEQWQEGIHVLEYDYMSDLPGAEQFPWIFRVMYKLKFFYKNMNQRMVYMRVDGKKMSESVK